LLQHRAAQPHRPSRPVGAERGGFRGPADCGADRRPALSGGDRVPGRIRSRAGARRVTVWSAHLSMLFRELPYLERPRAAAEAGFEAVETWWPANGAGIRWADETVRLGLSVCLVNAYGGDIEAGERGFLNVPERRAEAFDAFEAAVALAQRCGAGYV